MATHLLESMIENPTPTRAEVTDVANAIYEGADAVMLSGETTIGEHPVKCVEMLKELQKKLKNLERLDMKNFCRRKIRLAKHSLSSKRLVFEY